MELFFPIERALWIAFLVAEALVVARFLQLGLLRRYPFFLGFLTVELVSSLVLARHDLKSRDYAESYRVVTVILILFRFGVAAELYKRICDHFPGIGAFRTGMAAVLSLLAGLIAIFTFFPNLSGTWAFPVGILIVLVRLQYELFAAAFLLTWIFLRFVLSIRQPFRPNVLTHWTLATVYFGAAGAAYLAAQLAGAGTAVYPVNSALLAIQLGCFIAWIVSMRRSGEEIPRFPRLSADQVSAVERYNRELLGRVTSLPAEIAARQAEARDIPLRRARQL